MMVNLRFYNILSHGVEFLAHARPGTSVIQVRGRRRTLNSPPWVPDREEDIVKILLPEERERLEEIINEKKPFADAAWSERKTLPISWKAGEQVWTESSKRFGLIGRKIGMAPQWLTNGQRVLCTLIEIPQNHVISAVDPNSWFRMSSVGKRKAFGRFGPRWKITVGAGDANPALFTDEYRRMFEKIGVPPKQMLGSFVVTEDAIVEPGTALDVRHFKIGQKVNVTGKTIDWGFQGVMHRWGFAGGRWRGNTKSHRRVGVIGSKGEAKVWLGKRNAGHMGYEWRTVKALPVVRINPIKQVLYVKGSVPGDVGDTLLIKDCATGPNKVQNPPFPTYFKPKEETNAENEQSKVTWVISQDLYHPLLFRFTDPSIVFTEKDEIKTVARDRTRAKLAKVKK